MGDLGAAVGQNRARDAFSDHAIFLTGQLGALKGIRTAVADAGRVPLNNGAAATGFIAQTNPTYDPHTIPDEFMPIRLILCLK